MGFWTRLKQTPLIKTPRHVTPYRWSAGTNYGDYKSGRVSFEQQRLSYEQNSIIRSCVDTILAEAESAEWDIVAVEQDGGDLKINAEQWAMDWGSKRNISDIQTLRNAAADKHEKLKYEQRLRMSSMRKFFQQPNDDDDFTAFFHKVGHDILVMDAGGIEKEFSDTTCAALWPVAGETIRIRSDEHGQVLGYTQGESVANSIDFDEDSFIYLLMNPRTSTPYGLSPIETLHREIATDLFQLGFTSKFFENNGIPPGILTLFGSSEEEFKRWLRQIEVQKARNPSGILVTGVKNAGEMAYTPLRGQGKDDSEGHIELSDWILKRVCGVYRVSPGHIGFVEGMGGLGSNTSHTQKSIHANKAVKPLLNLFERKFTSNVLHRSFDMTDLKFSFTYIDPDAEQIEHEKDMKDLEAGVVTINEIRKKRGESPKPWGDVPFNSQTLKSYNEQTAMEDPKQQTPGQDSKSSGEVHQKIGELRGKFNA